MNIIVKNRIPVKVSTFFWKLYNSRYNGVFKCCDKYLNLFIHLYILQDVLWFYNTYWNTFIFWHAPEYASGNDRGSLRRRRALVFNITLTSCIFFVSKNNDACNFNIKNMLYYLWHRTVIYVPNTYLYYFILSVIDWQHRV